MALPANGSSHPKISPNHPESVTGGRSGSAYRVAIVETSSGFGGTAKCVYQWLQCLDRSRFEPYVFARARTGWYEQEAVRQRAAGVFFSGRQESSPARGGVIRRYSERLTAVGRMAPAAWSHWRMFRRLGIDLVHTNNTVFDHLPAIAAARLLSIPVVCHLHDHVPLTRLERAWVPLVDRFCVLSSAARDLYSAAIPEDRITVIPNGLLLSEIDSTPATETDTPLRRPGIALVGRLVEWKGHETLLRALPLVRERVPGATAYLIGDDLSANGRCRERLRVMAESLGCSEAVVFTGWQADPRALLSQMDVSVCPSLSPEPFGLVLLESMAMGVPVVASQHGGPLDIIDDGNDGLLFQPGDAHELARRILQILGNRDFARRLATRARKKVRSCFALERIVARLEETYVRVLTSRAPKVLHL